MIAEPRTSRQVEAAMAQMVRDARGVATVASSIVIGGLGGRLAERTGQKRASQGD